jgi:uncharacterized cupin superfamily protein
MHRISQNDLEWEHGTSPKGRFERYTKNVSGKMKPESGPVTPRGNYPFEVSLVRVPPGKRPWPQHRHELQWEYYTVLEGTGAMRCDDDSQVSLKPGDALMFPPGEAHTIINTGTADLVIQIIADNPPGDIVHYPDSNKWAVRPPGKRFRMTEVTNYYDGEE